MGERKFDQSLNIRTVGLREWRDSSLPYHRYEATPYRALDQLFSKYHLSDTDQLVDFGCGRGRVLFYIHQRFQIPVTGVEVNELTLNEALRNKRSYRRRASRIPAPIRLEYGLAEQYEIQPEDNRFFFFNPFSVQIFRQVVSNIVESAQKFPRAVDLILYYPTPEYKRFIHNETNFKLFNKVKVSGAKDPLEKFLLYRLDTRRPSDEGQIGGV